MRQAIIWTNDGLVYDAYMRHSEQPFSIQPVENMKLCLKCLPFQGPFSI